MRKENVLIIGSGAAIHGFHTTEPKFSAFMSELTEILTQYNEQDRVKALLNWDSVLPYARINHPREDHLMPIHVVVGAAGSDRGQLLNPNIPCTQASFKFGV